MIKTVTKDDLIELGVLVLLEKLYILVKCYWSIVALLSITINESEQFLQP